MCALFPVRRFKIAPIATCDMFTTAQRSHQIAAIDGYVVNPVRTGRRLRPFPVRN